jgi:hypothetical protein
MISTSEIEMEIEQPIGELVNLQDGRWTFMPQRFFLATTNFQTFASILFYQPNHHCHLDVISNHNWVIEWNTREEEEAGDAEGADSKGLNLDVS